MTQESVAEQFARACCASFYQSDAARLLLGDSLHPGGERLTSLLAERLNLDSLVKTRFEEVPAV